MRTYETCSKIGILLAALSAGCTSSSQQPSVPPEGSGGAEGGTGGQSGGTGGQSGGTSGRSGSGGTPAVLPDASSGGTIATDAGTKRDAGGDGSSAPKPALHATAIDTYTTETAKVPRAVNLSGYAISVLVYDATTKKFSAHPPTIVGPGEFKVDTLPPGDRYVGYSPLGAPPAYVLTGADELDFGRPRFGRPDLGSPASGTKLAFNVSGLQAWQTGDVLEFFSLGAGSANLDAEATTIGAPILDDTALTGLTLDYAGDPALSLIDGSLGDRAYLAQLSARTMPGGNAYVAMSRLFSMPSFTMTDGQTTTISGAFTTPPAGSLDVDWKASRYEAEVLAGNPGGTVVDRLLGASAQPYAEFGPFSASLDMFFYDAPDATDLVSTFAFTNPFSSTWPLYAGALTTLVKKYTLPSTQPLKVYARVDTRLQVSSAVTFSPLIGCVRNPTIGGKDALTDESGVGTTPTVTFEAPSTGTPNGYEVVFYRLTDAGGTTTAASVGQISTTGLTVVVPPGLLTTGNAYFMLIRADVRGSIDMSRRPLVFAFPGAGAESLSGIIRP